MFIPGDEFEIQKLDISFRTYIADIVHYMFKGGFLSG